ncbi:MAG: hypothetical protein RL518_286 [Pseudomonadota bacterium]
MTTNLLRCIVPAILITTLGMGCARTNHSPMPTIDPKIKEQLDAPIDCTTAKQDIATLEDARASVAKEVISGARAIIPFSAAAGVATGDEQDRAEVATGVYNDRIDAKVAAIKRKCIAYLGEV